MEEEEEGEKEDMDKEAEEKEEEEEDKDGEMEEGEVEEVEEEEGEAPRLCFGELAAGRGRLRLAPLISPVQRDNLGAEIVLRLPCRRQLPCAAVRLR